MFVLIIQIPDLFKFQLQSLCLSVCDPSDCCRGWGGLTRCWHAWRLAWTFSRASSPSRWQSEAALCASASTSPRTRSAQVVRPLQVWWTSVLMNSPTEFGFPFYLKEGRKERKLGSFLIFLFYKLKSHYPTPLIRWPIILIMIFLLLFSLYTLGLYLGG